MTFIFPKSRAFTPVTHRNLLQNHTFLRWLVWAWSGHQVRSKINDFPRNHWKSMNLTWFQWKSMKSIEFEWISMKSIEICWNWHDFNEKYWNLMNLTWFQWKVMKSCEFDMNSIKSYEICWISHDFTEKVWNLLNFTWFHGNLMNLAWVHSNHMKSNEFYMIFLKLLNMSMTSKVENQCALACLAISQQTAGTTYTHIAGPNENT